MDKSQARSPYRSLGKRLKQLRNLANESLADASGAVEIDVRLLASFELGQSRPSEDVLLLLLSHFGVKDDEAVKIWDMAGYDMQKIPVSHMANHGVNDAPAAITSTDHVLFTDVVDVVVNNYGVVMNFMQNTASGVPPTKVARVGMSREHAKSVLQILQLTLSQTEKKVPRLPNKLIAPDPSSDEIKSS